MSNIEDFNEGQWWLKELDAMAKDGTPDQKRAVAVVRNLMATAKAQQPQAPTESVLIDGIAYDIPAPVAAELLRLHIEARQPQAEAVAPGYVLVPVKPTDEMIDAACSAVDDLYRMDFLRAYTAAIAQQKGGQ